jgi:hypothetical protein
MLGFNGGLLGTKRTTNVMAAPGIWFLNEQGLAQRDGLWPPFDMSSLSPVLWYDFPDETTVTVSDSRISQITNKGSAALNLTKSTTGPAYSIGINGLKCVDWGSSPHANFLRNTSATSFTLAELYIVQDSAFGGSAPNFNGLVGNANSQTVRLYASGSSITLNGYSGMFLNGSAAPSLPFVSSLDSPSLLRLLFSSPTSLNAGFILGNETVNFGFNRGWYGLVGEVIGFSSGLSDRERSSVQLYLEAKWGLTLTN